jgi:hypothetical protein
MELPLGLLIWAGYFCLYFCGQWLLPKLKGKAYSRSLVILLLGLAIGACSVIAYDKIPVISGFFKGPIESRSHGRIHFPQSSTTSKSTSSTISIPKSKPSTSIDPAIEIKNNYTFYGDDRYPSLNSNIEYSKAVGDLARIQEKMLRDRSQARNYPDILIGNGRFTGKCDTRGTSIGSYYYGNGCKTILINFSSDGIAYEYPIEVLTVLAHEYAHHLVNATIGTNNVSDLDGELIADCFAGLVHGYWDRYGKVNEQEVVAAANMMIQVSTKDHMNTSAMHGVAGQRLGAFMGGALKATGKESVEYNNFCRSLDRVIDWKKGLP